MPAATAAFFATCLSFAPALFGMRLFDFDVADLLAFVALLAFRLVPARFGEDLDFLRLAFFINSSRFTKFVDLGLFFPSVARGRTPLDRLRGTFGP
jgi:hypothetical protein